MSSSVEKSTSQNPETRGKWHQNLSFQSWELQDLANQQENAVNSLANGLRDRLAGGLPEKALVQLHEAVALRAKQEAGIDFSGFDPFAVSWQENFTRLILRPELKHRGHQINGAFWPRVDSIGLKTENTTIGLRDYYSNDLKHFRELSWYLHEQNHRDRNYPFWLRVVNFTEAVSHFESPYGNVVWILGTVKALAEIRHIKKALKQEYKAVYGSRVTDLWSESLAYMAQASWGFFDRQNVIEIIGSHYKIKSFEHTLPNLPVAIAAVTERIAAFEAIGINPFKLSLNIKAPRSHQGVESDYNLLIKTLDNALIEKLRGNWKLFGLFPMDNVISLVEMKSIIDELASRFWARAELRQATIQTILSQEGSAVIQEQLNTNGLLESRANSSQEDKFAIQGILKTLAGNESGKLLHWELDFAKNEKGSLPYIPGSQVALGGEVDEQKTHYQQSARNHKTLALVYTKDIPSAGRVYLEKVTGEFIRRGIDQNLDSAEIDSVVERICQNLTSSDKQKLIQTYKTGQILLGSLRDDSSKGKLQKRLSQKLITEEVEQGNLTPTEGRELISQIEARVDYASASLSYSQIIDEVINFSNASGETIPPDLLTFLNPESFARFLGKRLQEILTSSEQFEAVNVQFPNLEDALNGNRQACLELAEKCLMIRNQIFEAMGEINYSPDEGWVVHIEDVSIAEGTLRVFEILGRASGVDFSPDINHLQLERMRITLDVVRAVIEVA